MIIECLTNTSKFDNMKENRTKTIGIKVTNKEFEALTEICNALQTNKSVFIRNLIHKELF